MKQFLTSLLGGSSNTRVSCGDRRCAALCGRASLPASRKVRGRLARTLALPCFDSTPALNIEHKSSTPRQAPGRFRSPQARRPCPLWVAHLLVTAALVVAVVFPARAEGPAGTSAVDRAVVRGVNFLLTKQDDDGAIGKFDRHNKDNSCVMTALALMAMASVGHQASDDTREGRAMRKALDYILAPERQDATGYYGKYDGARMYGHGIVTLMLAELLGMGVDARQDALIRDRCQKAIDLIVRAQKVHKHNPKYEGGWRYTPDAPDADLSVTVWQVMALRAAKNSGLTVPKDTIDAAIAYIKRSYNSGKHKSGRLVNLKSAFGYEPDHGPTFSTASEGLLALQVCGDYDAEELKGTTAWLHEQKIEPSQRFFYYGMYYYAQGMYQRGGDDAEKARELVEKIMLAEQKDDGAWVGRDQETVSKVYSTSLAILSLSVRYHFMPIYQR